jgi:hypothetical protein
VISSNNGLLQTFPAVVFLRLILPGLQTGRTFLAGHLAATPASLSKTYARMNAIAQKRTYWSMIVAFKKKYCNPRFGRMSEFKIVKAWAELD